MARGGRVVYLLWLLPLLVAIFAAYRVIHRLHYDEAMYHHFHAHHDAGESFGDEMGEADLDGELPLPLGWEAAGHAERPLGGEVEGHDERPEDFLQGGRAPHEEQEEEEGEGEGGGAGEADEEGAWGSDGGGGLLASKEYVGKEVHAARSKPVKKQQPQQQQAKSSPARLPGFRGASTEQRIRAQVNGIFQQVAANQARVEELRRRGMASSVQQAAMVRSTMDKVQRKNDKAHALPPPSRAQSSKGGESRTGRRSRDDEDKRARERKEHEAHEREKEATRARDRQERDKREKEERSERHKQHEDPDVADGGGGQVYDGDGEGAAAAGGGDGDTGDQHDGHDQHGVREDAGVGARSNACPLAPDIWNPLGGTALRRRRLLGGALSFQLGWRAAGGNHTSPARRRLSSFSEAAQGHKSYGVSCEKGAPLKARQACYEQRMLKRCEGEKRKKQLQEGEEELARCIRDMHSCTTPRSKLAELARGLKGIQMLLGPAPKCMVYNNRVACDSVHANDETALTMGCGERGGGPKEGCDKRVMTGFSQSYIKMPARDLRRRHFRTCAVVGNSMNLFRTANGASIDAHDMVMRFNNEVARMEHVLSQQEGGPLADHKIGHYIGRKTGVRLLNRKYTVQMLEGEADPNRLVSSSKIKVHFPKEERLIFWNYFSAPYIKALQQKYWWNQILLMAPEMINWQLEAFSQLRKDLYRLGLAGSKGFGCYRSMSSGVHGLFLAFQLCESVDLYGFSVSMDNFKKGFNHGRPSESHSWEFETMLMRLIYYAGMIDVCNW